MTLKSDHSLERNVRSVLLFLISLYLCCFPANAQVEVETSQPDTHFWSDVWHPSASPYLWLAGLDGTLNLSATRLPFTNRSAPSATTPSLPG